MLIVFTTAPTVEEASSLAGKIVEARLAACVQIMPPMTSVYVWEGEVRREPEYLLLIKTLPEKWDELERFISVNHRYEVPEIVAIDSERVSGPYLEWIAGLLG
jgi:periplasmic divalent cation tolerance protein